MNYSDIIYGVFAFFGENREFTTERIRIHNAFYKLAKNEEFQNLFSDITFSTSEEYHKSIEIDQCIDNLILSRLITANNPDLVKYQITPGFSEYYQENEKEFFPNNSELIKKMSENLYPMVCN
jgi:hypothetical protein